MRTLLMMSVLLLTTAMFAESNYSDKEKIKKLWAIIEKRNTQVKKMGIIIADQAAQIAKLKAVVVEQAVSEKKTGNATPLEKKLDKARLVYNDGLKVVAKHKKRIDQGRSGMKGSTAYRKAIVANKEMEVDNYEKALAGGVFIGASGHTPSSARERLYVLQRELKSLRKKQSRRKKKRVRTATGWKRL